MTGSTVDVVQYRRLVLSRNVFEHFHRQHPVVTRQPVLWQRQVQKLHLYTVQRTPIRERPSMLLQPGPMMKMTKLPIFSVP